MLGSRIAVLRRAKGWSQSELARRLQVSPSAVGMYEQGRREPAAEVLVALSEQLGVTVDYLLTGKMTEESSESAEKAFETMLQEAQARLAKRKTSPLSRQELAVLFAAMLMES